MNKKIGKKTWVFADGDLPPKGTEAPFGHEAVCITNCGDQDAEITIHVLFTDRDPDQVVVCVPARRVNCFYLDQPIGAESYQIPFGQYALVLESNEPVVAVMGRMDRRKDIAYYALDGYAE